MPSRAAEQVIRRSSNLSGIVRDFRSRVQALNGSLTSQEISACEYLLAALRNQNQNPANVVVYAYLGGINGIVVPFLNRDGATGNATNSGPYVAGDLSIANGITQSGTKRLEAPLTTAQLGVVSWSFGAYNGGNTSAQRALFGAAGVGTANFASLQYRAFASAVQGGGMMGTYAGANECAGSTAATTSGRLMVVSASTTDQRLFRAGTQDGSTNTNARTAIGGSIPIWLGAYNNNGSIAIAANANLCVHAFGCGVAITPAQASAIDAIFREFLVRLGRNPCD